MVLAQSFDAGWIIGVEDKAGIIEIPIGRRSIFVRERRPVTDVLRQTRVVIKNVESEMEKVQPLLIALLKEKAIKGPDRFPSPYSLAGLPNDQAFHKWWGRYQERIHKGVTVPLAILC